MIITEEWANVRYPRIIRTECAIGLLRTLINWIRPDEITEKNTNKGYNRTLKYSNGLRITVSRHEVTWVF